MIRRANPNTRYRLEFFVVTPGGGRTVKTEVMTLAQIEAEVARTNYRTRNFEVVE